MAKVGRPRIELENLGKDWEQRMLNLAKEGASIVELAVELGISKDTFYALSEREPEFSDSVKICKDLSENWWEKQGRTNLQNKHFNYTGWYMNMKNRFGWKDRNDITTNDKDVTMPILGGKSVQGDNSDSQAAATEQED